MRRFKFVIGAPLRCVPLCIHDVQLGFALLEHLTEGYEPKKNFQNTWNDILILATAINRAATLVTEDTLLSRFAADSFHAHTQPREKFIAVSFPGAVTEPARGSLESKGYVNTSWRVYEARSHRRTESQHS